MVNTVQNADSESIPRRKHGPTRSGPVSVLCQFLIHPWLEELGAHTVNLIPSFSPNLRAMLMPLQEHLPNSHPCPPAGANTSSSSE